MTQSIRQRRTHLIRRWEEISNNGWPALQTLQYDGWLLRFADGVTKRSNSVSMLYPSRLPLEEKIDFCEVTYTHRGIPPCFKITSGSESSTIDSSLGHRGYTIPATISFQVAPIIHPPTPSSKEILIEKGMNETWIDHFIRMNRFESTRKPVYLAIMKQIIIPKCLVSVMRGEQTIGVGLGVAEGGCVGLFDLVVDPDYRNQGVGTDIVKRIMQWGYDQGARSCYLQVLTDNIQAINIYRKTGFKEIYQYWYRMKPLR